MLVSVSKEEFETKIHSEAVSSRIHYTIHSTAFYNSSNELIAVMETSSWNDDVCYYIEFYNENELTFRLFSKILNNFNQL